MRLSFLPLLLLPLAQIGLALPHQKTPPKACGPNGTMKFPPPCKPIAPRPGQETDKRFFRYGEAFIVDKDLTKAFRYISANYTNHHQGATTPIAAFNDLSQLWPPMNITVLRIAFKGDTGWLNYLANGTEVVDRYRWESGCIVEHWDAGEVFPDCGVF